MDDHFSSDSLLFGGRFTRNTNDPNIQATWITLYEGTFRIRAMAKNVILELENGWITRISVYIKFLIHFAVFRFKTFINQFIPILFCITNNKIIRYANGYRCAQNANIITEIPSWSSIISIILRFVLYTSEYIAFNATIITSYRFLEHVFIKVI